MDVPTTRTAAEVIQDYRDAIAESEEILGAIADFEQLTAVPTAHGRHTVRWVVAHMPSETARHAGHAADILRELIDGTTGR